MREHFVFWLFLYPISKALYAKARGKYVNNSLIISTS